MLHDREAIRKHDPIKIAVLGEFADGLPVFGAHAGGEHLTCIAQLNQRAVGAQNVIHSPRAIGGICSRGKVFIGVMDGDQLRREFTEQLTPFLPTA